MKRSRSINLAAMRKPALFSTLQKPLCIAVAAATLSACGSNEPDTARVYKSVTECVSDAAGTQIECQQAYDDAVAEAKKSGPKFNTQDDCEAEFGNGQCQSYRGSQGQSWFMPLVAGYMIGRVIDNVGGYHRYSSAPLYTSYSYNSPYYGRWSTTDGYNYGSVNNRNVSVNKSTFESKPAVTKTISRGGFGSKVAAKSNWGGGGSFKTSKTSSGWGG